MRTRQEINAYTAAYKRRKRRERGLLPKGGIRIPRTEEEKQVATTPAESGKKHIGKHTCPYIQSIKC